jgi:hypothetical protein
MKSLFLMAVVLVMPLGGPAQTAGGGSARVAAVQQARYYRTELYMGRSIPGGGEVSDDDWEEFLNDTVTTRFPEGFTVLTGRGQWREASGKVAKELSQVLVFLYKRTDRELAGKKIEEIRKEYIRRFRQEAVMRIDFSKNVLVAF